MKITKRSQISGKINTMDLDITEAQIEKFKNGEDHIQYIFPNLSDGEREFILTGITPEEWDELFPPEDD